VRLNPVLALLRIVLDLIKIYRLRKLGFVPMTRNKFKKEKQAKKHSEIDQISVFGITESIGSLALHHYAESFLNAALSLPPNPTLPFEPVRPYLICHAIELGLKAFLTLHTVTFDELVENEKIVSTDKQIELKQEIEKWKGLYKFPKMRMKDLADAKYGHKLETLLKKAKEKNIQATIPFTDDHLDAILLASTYYAEKVFEYPAVGEAIRCFPKMPPIETLLDAAMILVESLRQPCLEAK